MCVCVYHGHTCVSTHILCMLLGTRGHAADELSTAAKVCTLSSPSACKKNGSFTSFFEPPRSSQRQMAPPLPPLPPLCGRQVAMLLAFTVGRRTQKRWVGKDSVPLWTPCLSTLTRRVSMSRRSLTFDLCHRARHTAKKQRRINSFAVSECARRCE